MKLSKHIATYYLTHPEYQELTLANYVKMNFNGSDRRLDEKGMEYIQAAIITDPAAKKYVVSQTVIDRFDMFKIDKVDWTLFKPEMFNREVYILPDNTFFYLHRASDGYIQFMYCVARADGMLCVDLGDFCTLIEDHAISRRMKGPTELLFKLLCFLHFTDNEEITLPANTKRGNILKGILNNDSSFAATFVNARWHKTVIRTEGFPVRGHWAIRKIGPGRTQTRLVFIQPYNKDGYTRSYNS
jgi:hypothetical protein